MLNDNDNNNLCKLSASKVISLLKRGEVSPLELVEASAERIRLTDRHTNAIPTRCFDRARQHAKQIMKNTNTQQIDNPAWLGGLPISVKDLVAVKNVRTTWGSPIFASHIPSKSDILVETLESNGAIVMGKSNTPEFGAGANTFNEVFGKTYNPWNTSKTCGGSSGGAAVSLATGQVWMATGSDLGGSLRIPASYCSVTGLRPTPGRVPHGPADIAFDTLSVDGPMGRDALDTAIFLDAMCGINLNDPISFPKPFLPFADAVHHKHKHLPTRVAFSPDLGIFPVDKKVAEICKNAALCLEKVGIKVEDDRPSFKNAVETFQVLRAALFAGTKINLLEHHRDALKPELIWNIEKGLSLTSQEIGKAQVARSKLYHRMSEFFLDYDLLICPTVITPPFDVNIRYIEELDGHKFDNYVDWLGMTFVLSLTGCPAISTPAGFTDEGLPVGLQIIAPPQAESKLLAIAAILEEIVDLPHKTPISPRQDTTS